MTATSRAQMARAMTEDDLKAAILDACSVYGWLVHHSRPSRERRDGADVYRTAIEGDAGLPDLILAHPKHGVLFRELKSERGHLRPDQQVWLAALADGGANVDVWTPTAWVDGLIDLELRGGIPR